MHAARTPYQTADIELANIFVKIKADNLLIAEHLQRFPSAAYLTQVEPAISPDPIACIRSQPLPNFGIAPSLENVAACLGDFGSGTLVV